MSPPVGNSGGAAAQSDEHGRTAQHNNLRANGHFALLNIRPADIAHAAGDHDGLVVTAHPARIIGCHALLKSPEITADGIEGFRLEFKL